MSDDEDDYDSDDESRRRTYRNPVIAGAATLPAEDFHTLHNYLYAVDVMMLAIRFKKRYPRTIEEVNETWYAFYGRDEEFEAEWEEKLWEEWVKQRLEQMEKKSES